MKELKWLAGAIVYFSCGLLWGFDFPDFVARTIDPHVGEICYAVTLADVNGDGRDDVVAVSERGVYWYENPNWDKRTIIEDQTKRDNVCIAPADINRDGLVDFALGAGWTEQGTLQWLERSKSLDDPWKVHPIGSELWTHRMRVADVLGVGEPQVVVSPLNRTQGQGVRLLAWRIPERPEGGQWQATVLNHELNRMHNHWHVDLNNDSQIDTLTASREGINWIYEHGGEWKRKQIHVGASGDSPGERGAGEVKVGQLGGERFITSIEPMHGNQVVVYRQPAGASTAGGWKRQVLEESLRRGHALWPADVDRDDRDEIIVGHSDPGPGPIPGPGIYVYDLVKSSDGGEDAGSTVWKKHVIDNGGIATEDAIAADLNEDGWIDIVAGGRKTHNVKIYFNQGNAGQGHKHP